MAINVTKTYLPSKLNYQKYVDKIFSSGWITNNGPLLNELEQRLADYLGVNNIILVANGTAALEVAYRTLDLHGEVITSPFSFVATTSSLVTNGLKPVFVDIDPDTLNIDVNKIEGAISTNTTAIVPVHVFGNACDVDAIAKIAQKNNLKIVYDAAHAFGVENRQGESLLNYGDISVLSFHATKLFHTIEGGALIINDDTLVEKARYLINFGIENAESIPELGINAKMNEFEAAMGLCMLDEMEPLLHRRKVLYKRYEQGLKSIIRLQKHNKNYSQNYSYFPIVLKDEAQTLRLQKALQAQQIFPRRYFYPSLDTLSYIKPKQYSPISREVSQSILALPLYPELTDNEQNTILDIINTAIGF